LVLECDRLIARVMTEIADGNPVTMSATQDISSLDRPEGFTSSGLSPCSNASLGGTLKTPVVNAVNPETDPETEVEGGASGKATSESNIPPGEVAASHDEVAPLATHCKILRTAPLKNQHWMLQTQRLSRVYLPQKHPP
jgi:hypothetical protein